MADRHSLKRKPSLRESDSSRKTLKKKRKKDGLSQATTTRKVSSGRSVRIVEMADRLPWKTVSTPFVTDFGDEGEGGIMGLEEVEGVEVVYEDSEGGQGRVVSFRVADSEVAEKGEETSKTDTSTIAYPPIIIEPLKTDALPSWSSYPLHPVLLHSLHQRGFTEPTPIQKETLDVIFGTQLTKDQPSEQKEQDEHYQNEQRGQRDIVGVAQTGSGKTLAYGLPILHHLLTTLSSTAPDSQVAVNIPSIPAGERRPIKALILTPTRELAIQVTEHLSKCLDMVFTARSRQLSEDNNDASSSKLKPKPPPPVSVAAIVGGMSAQKQRRVIEKGVDILVVTPGRFWDLCQEDPWLAPQLRSLRFLVLDEADRMIEAGHFQELDSILRLTTRETITNDETEHPPTSETKPVDLQEFTPRNNPNEELQTFIYSATMSKDLQKDLKRKKSRKKKDPATTLDELLMKLDFRDPNPVIIDLSPSGGKIQGLQESIVECLASNKDAYLYYFLLRHPGKSLVFLGSIDGIRRLMPLLDLLKIPAWPLHSGLQQKQRLKNFDRFKSTHNAVLLATDVAARGLDVPAVDHVIHYQVPRTADTYVHRNGRTARAMQQGFGLVLCAPDEKRVFKGVLDGLGRDEVVPELKVDHDILNKLKGRIQLAKQIDGLMHKVKKKNHEKSWMKEAAEAMEVELESDLESDNSETVGKSSKKRAADSKVAALKAELNHALKQPLVALGVSMKYLTSGTRAIADDLVAGNSHETMLGLPKMRAGSEVVKKRHVKK